MSGLLKKIKVLQAEDENVVRPEGISNEVVEKLEKELKDALKAAEEGNKLRLKVELLKKLQDEKEASQGHEITQLHALRKDAEAKLQTANEEIEILKALVAEQKEQLIESCTQQEADAESNLEVIEKYKTDIKDLQTELEIALNQKSSSHETYVDELKENINHLELLLNENKLLSTQQAQELINKQETIDTLNGQIVELYKTMEENTNRLIEKEGEIAYLEELVNAKAADLDKLFQENNENKKVIEKLLMELHSQTEKIAQVDTLTAVQERNRQLEARVKELEKLNSISEMRCKEQHDKLKKFAANLKKKVAQCAELESKIKELTRKSEEMDVISARVESIDLHGINLEVDALKQKLCLAEDQTQKLVEEKELLANELNRKHSELSHARDQLELYIRKVEETTVQLGEMQALVEILHSDFDKKSQNEQYLQEQISRIQGEYEDRLQALMDGQHAKSAKFEKCKAVLKEKMREVQRLSAENGELVQKLHSFEDKSNAVGTDIAFLQEENTRLKQENKKLLETYEQEKVTFQDTIARLETLHDGIQAKLQEDMAYIESLELENNKFKEKICRLEECVASFEERRSSLEKRANVLDAQLQEKKDEYEKNEDALVYRLNMLSEHDDLIGRRLLETQEEKEELVDKLDRTKRDYKELLDKFIKLEKEFETFQKEKYENAELENVSLQEQVNGLQAEVSKIQSTYEAKLMAKTAEIDDLENELSVQLKNVSLEKKSLQEDLEKTHDEVIALKDENVKLKESANSLEQIKNDLEREITWIRMQNENLSQDQYELQELRMQVIHDKTEIENQKHQLDTLVQNHEVELNVLRTQMAELDSMRVQVSQNQTDDQAFIETENKRLKELLAEKEAVIDNYQRQNLQLQMSALSTAVADPFAAISEGDAAVIGGGDQVDTVALAQKCREYETEIADLRAKLHEKAEEHTKLTEELSQLQQEVQRITFEKQRDVDHLTAELERLRAPRSDLTSAFSFDQPISSVFEEIAAVNQVQLLEAGAPDQKKIEDLERNVSDLEKYAAELEYKLKHLTSVHEETLRQLQQKSQALEDLEKNTTLRIKDLEEKEKQFNTQHNIEKIWSDNQDPNTMSLSMFFDASQPGDQIDEAFSSSEPKIPVEEEVIVPEKAYICYKKTETDANKHDLEEDWGWGSEEAVLEEKYHSSTSKPRESLLSPDTNMQVKCQEYQDRIKELELERTRWEDQKIELQVKSGKMMKKLKEYKNKLAQLSDSQTSFRKSCSVESSDLDIAIQEELKSQVNQLEEKVSELKKQIEKGSVEKENHLKRIDVLSMANDRLTELKERQDIELEAYQAQIRQLNQKLKVLEDWSENSNQIIKHEDQVTESKEDWQQKYLDLSREMNDLKVDRDELQALLDEEKQNTELGEKKIDSLQTKIAALEEDLLQCTQKSVTQAGIELEYQSLKNQFNETKLTNQSLQLQLSDYQSIVDQLSNESKSIAANLDILREEHRQKLDENSKLTSELQSLVGKNNDLSREIELMRLTTSTISQGPEVHFECEQRIAQLETRLSFLDNEITTKSSEVSRLLAENEGLSKVKDSLEQEVAGKQFELTQLQEKVDMLTKEKSELNERIATLDGSLAALQSEKEHMEVELQVLNTHVINSLENEDRMKQAILELDMKNIEISELKNSLETLKAQQTEQLQPNFDEESEQLQQLNQHWEAIVEQRCGEIADSWSAHLASKTAEFKQIEEGLREEVEKLKTATASTVTKPTCEPSEPAEDAEENSKLIEKMQAALESQELEIVTLKEQLAMRSAEYARLAAQHDPYAQSTTSSSAFNMNLLQKPVNIDQRSLVQLDLAWYMLHQRDMKCEELTLELLNLLEERDTLQLKLSNSLRQIEEIKRKTGYVESGSDSDQGLLSNPNTPTKSRPPATDATSEDDTSVDNRGLNIKISQLHSTNLSKDKRLVEERNQGQRDLDKIQEDVAKIPPEAVSQLVGKDLSASNQSPSSVLLNWLWGKSTNSQEN